MPAVSSEGSCARTSRSSSCSAGPGSTPSSSASVGTGPLVRRERVALAPGRYCAAMSSAQNDSRIGCQRTSASSSATGGGRPGRAEVGRDAALERVEAQRTRAGRPRPRAARTRRTRRTACPATGAGRRRGSPPPRPPARRAAPRVPRAELELEHVGVDATRGRRRAGSPSVPSGPLARRQGPAQPGHVRVQRRRSRRAAGPRPRAPRRARSVLTSRPASARAAPAAAAAAARGPRRRVPRD